MDTLVRVSPQVLLARARLWQWISLAFWYPDAGFLAGLRDQSARRELDELAEAAADDSDLPAATAAIWHAIDTLDSAGPGIPEEHTYLFERQVKTSPHETAYRFKGGVDPAPVLAELRGIYAAFGIQPGALRPARPDHICVQSEFVAALLAKEAYADAHGWRARARITRQARHRFVHEHPAAWFPSLAAQLRAHHRQGFYPAVAELALALLAAEGETLTQAADLGHRAPVAELAAVAPIDTGEFRDCPADTGLVSVTSEEEL